MKKHFYIVLLGVLTLVTACSVSYGFQGGKLNYDKTKTISIKEFPNRASFVEPMLAQIFDQELRNRFVEQTRLEVVSNNGDIHIEGEIVTCNTQGVAVKEDAYASRTRVTVAVRVRYTNRQEPGQDVNQTFSSFAEYDSSPTIPEDKLQEVCEAIVDMIYNATVGNW